MVTSLNWLTLLSLLVFGGCINKNISWVHNTPCGHSIGNLVHENAISGKDTIYLKNAYSWYFYRCHIVGTYTPMGYGDSINYFIFDEKSGILRTFHNKENWRKSINQKSLNPYYTRWFKTHHPHETWWVVFWVALVVLIVFRIAERVFLFNYSVYEKFKWTLIVVVIAIGVLTMVNPESF